MIIMINDKLKIYTMAYKFMALKHMKNEQQIIKITTSKRVSVGKITRKPRQKWNNERFLLMANSIHHHMYDYVLPESAHINTRTHITMTCKMCDRTFEKTVQRHIYYKSGCETCSNSSKKMWTFERFLEKAKKIYGDKYNYVPPESGHVNSHTQITMTCVLHNHTFEKSICNHIYNKSECTYCASKKRWTFERFLEKAKKIYGDKYNYASLESGHVNSHTQITMTCVLHNHTFENSIYNHIYNKSECTYCASKKRWTFERFLKEAEHIHGTTYVYTCDDISIKSSSRIDIKCLVCHHQWQSTVANHIYNKSGYCTIFKFHKTTPSISYGDIYPGVASTVNCDNSCGNCDNSSCGHCCYDNDMISNMPFEIKDNNGAA